MSMMAPLQLVCDQTKARTPGAAVAARTTVQKMKAGTIGWMSSGGLQSGRACLGHILVEKARRRGGKRRVEIKPPQTQLSCSARDIRLISSEQLASLQIFGHRFNIAVDFVPYEDFFLETSDDDKER